MADYPDLCQAASSTRSDTTSVQTDQAEDGTIRGRSFFSTRTYSFNITHEALSRADYDTLEAFVDANYGTTFNFTWKADGIEYECVFSQMPVITPVQYDRFTVNVGMLGSEIP